MIQLRSLSSTLSNSFSIANEEVNYRMLLKSGHSISMGYYIDFIALQSRFYHMEPDNMISMLITSILESQ